MPEQPRDQVSWLTVTDQYAGQRIDNYLCARLKGVPKSRVYRLLRKGEIRINKGRAKADRRVQDGDVIRLPPIRVRAARSDQPPEGLCRRLDQAIVYEDDAIMVLNKPAGIAVHSGSGVAFGVIEAMQAIRQDNASLSLVHRLDRATSGCLLLCKDRRILPELNRMLAGREMDKHYLALVGGMWQGGQRTVSVPLTRRRTADSDHRNAVDVAGKCSETVFIARRRFAGYTLLEARLHSGRMHQIRAHAAHIGHPLLGDDKYGDRSLNRECRSLGLKRLFLHACLLRFRMPGSAREIRVEVPLADELQAFVAQLKNI